MGRRPNSHRQPTNLASPHRDQAVSKADGQGGVQRKPTRSDDAPAASLSAASNFYPVLAVCGLLLLAVGLVFGQTIRHEFVNYDDDDYVYNNPQVSRGLGAEGICWAFTHSHNDNWHPLTWISLMLDCQLYGLNAGGYHLTNVLLHAATTVLLFLVLRAMTGRFWPSAVVAALFAVHPLHVESVAWVTERKDVLSGLFFVLTLGAYVGYVRHRFSWLRYLAVMVFLALGLMAKPMLVTLPFVLLLLDYWPLDRMALVPGERAPVLQGRRSGRFSLLARLVLEKVPLLALVVVSCAVTIWAQRQALGSAEYFPWSWRIGNALISYVAYLGQFFYPAGLAVLYLRVGLELPLWKVFGALLVLLGITGAVLLGRRRCPYLLMGWLWYLGTLVPVIGLVQVGSQTMADRYTYLTQIGLYIALAWGVADVCRSWAYRHWLCGIASASMLLVLTGCAWRQTSFWRESEVLWIHTLACTSQNSVAHSNLGRIVEGRGRVDEAIAQYRRAVEILPSYAPFHNDLGKALAGQGRLDEAMDHYRKSLEIQPDNAVVHATLGTALVSQGRLDEAIGHYRKSLEIQPNSAIIHTRLGIALASRGQLDEAVEHYRKSLEIQPRDAETHYNLAFALARLGRLDEAIAHYRKGLDVKPDDAEARYQLGLALQRQGKIDEALAQYRQAVKIKPGYAEARNNLGAALQSRGRIDEAIAEYRKALEIKPDYARVYYNLGTVLAGRGRFDEALAQFRRALEFKPNDADAQNNLAWLLATCPADSLRNGAAAIEHAQRANQLCGGGRADVLNTLAAAYAEAGRFPEAVAAARKALELAAQQNHRDWVDVLRARIALYEAGKPCRNSPISLQPTPTRP